MQVVKNRLVMYVGNASTVINTGPASLDTTSVLVKFQSRYSRYITVKYGDASTRFNTRIEIDPKDNDFVGEHEIRIIL